MTCVACDSTDVALSVGVRVALVADVENVRNLIVPTCPAHASVGSVSTAFKALRRADLCAICWQCRGDVPAVAMLDDAGPTAIDATVCPTCRAVFEDGPVLRFVIP